jgi:hypothetical protein
MLAFLLLVLTQIPCTPGETSVVCSCKAGMPSACATLSLQNPEKAAEILAQLEKIAAQAKVVAAAAQKAEEVRDAKTLGPWMNRPTVAIRSGTGRWTKKSSHGSTPDAG